MQFSQNFSIEEESMYTNNGQSQLTHHIGHFDFKRNSSSVGPALDQSQKNIQQSHQNQQDQQNNQIDAIYQPTHQALQTQNFQLPLDNGYQGANPRHHNLDNYQLLMSSLMGGNRRYSSQQSNMKHNSFSLLQNSNFNRLDANQINQLQQNGHNQYTQALNKYQKQIHHNAQLNYQLYVRHKVKQMNKGNDKNSADQGKANEPLSPQSKYDYMKKSVLDKDGKKGSKQEARAISKNLTNQRKILDMKLMNKDIMGTINKVSNIVQAAGTNASRQSSVSRKRMSIDQTSKISKHSKENQAQFSNETSIVQGQQQNQSQMQNPNNTLILHHPQQLNCSVQSTQCNAAIDSQIQFDSVDLQQSSNFGQKFPANTSTQMHFFKDKIAGFHYHQMNSLNNTNMIEFQNNNPLSITSTRFNPQVKPVSPQNAQLDPYLWDIPKNQSYHLDMSMPKLPARNKYNQKFKQKVLLREKQQQTNQFLANPNNLHISTDRYRENQLKQQALLQQNFNVTPKAQVVKKLLSPVANSLEDKKTANFEITEDATFQASQQSVLGQNKGQNNVKQLYLNLPQTPGVVGATGGGKESMIMLQSNEDSKEQTAYKKDDFLDEGTRQMNTAESNRDELHDEKNDKGVKTKLFANDGKMIKSTDESTLEEILQMQISSNKLPHQQTSNSQHKQNNIKLAINNRSTNYSKISMNSNQQANSKAQAKNNQNNSQLKCYSRNHQNNQQLNAHNSDLDNILKMDGNGGHNSGLGLRKKKGDFQMNQTTYTDKQGANRQSVFFSGMRDNSKPVGEQLQDLVKKRPSVNNVIAASSRLQKIDTHDMINITQQKNKKKYQYVKQEDEELKRQLQNMNKDYDQSLTQIISLSLQHEKQIQQHLRQSQQNPSQAMDSFYQQYRTDPGMQNINQSSNEKMVLTKNKNSNNLTSPQSQELYDAGEYDICNLQNPKIHSIQRITNQQIQFSQQNSLLQMRDIQEQNTQNIILETSQDQKASQREINTAESTVQQQSFMENKLNKLDGSQIRDQQQPKDVFSSNDLSQNNANIQFENTKDSVCINENPLNDYIDIQQESSERISILQNTSRTMIHNQQGIVHHSQQASQSKFLQVIGPDGNVISKADQKSGAVGGELSQNSSCVASKKLISKFGKNFDPIIKLSQSSNVENSFAQFGQGNNSILSGDQKEMILKTQKEYYDKKQRKEKKNQNSQINQELSLFLKQNPNIMQNQIQSIDQVTHKLRNSNQTSQQPPHNSQRKVSPFGMKNSLNINTGSKAGGFLRKSHNTNQTPLNTNAQNNLQLPLMSPKNTNAHQQQRNSVGGKHMVNFLTSPKSFQPQLLQIASPAYQHSQMQPNGEDLRQKDASGLNNTSRLQTDKSELNQSTVYSPNVPNLVLQSSRIKQEKRYQTNQQLFENYMISCNLTRLNLAKNINTPVNLHHNLKQNSKGMLITPNNEVLCAGVTRQAKNRYQIQASMELPNAELQTTTFNNIAFSQNQD